MATAPAQQTFDLGRVFTNAFDVLGKHAPTFLGLAFVLAGIPGFILQMWLLRTAQAAPDVAYIMSAAFWLPVLAGILVGIFTAALLQASLIGATVRHLGGRPIELGQSIALALGRIVPLILLSILVGIAVVFGLMLLIVPGVILYLMFIVAVPAMIAERRGITDSMSRSAELTKGSRPMIFLLAIVIFVGGAIFASLVGAIFGMFAGDPFNPASIIVLAVGSALSDTLIAAVSAVLVASLYVELRTIKEGVSVDHMVEVFK